ncbi:gamma-glutamylcyclotransferase family protein [Halogranum rubrum]|uniref:Gamma-glutamylcyclotransferase AIG2-like domain-containing protein n=1 Tax=Halogranum salarium B-1 TaxID=1210908 RepID=J3EX14_9EURY|nr:hypothetical protein HSB1_17150 [Halogranum salarium B-1]
MTAEPPDFTVPEPDGLAGVPLDSRERFNYVPTEGPDMDTFVYGTLTNPEQVAQVVDSYSYVGAAVLEGLHPVEGRYPTLAPGGSVGGRLLRTADVAALDAYEGVDRDLYVRVSVPWVGDASQHGDRVAVYVGDPTLLDVADDVHWPGDGSLEARVERYVDDNDVTVRPAD